MKTIVVSDEEETLLEILRLSQFQKVTVSVESGRIVHFKREENIKPDTYQAKARKSLT